VIYFEFVVSIMDTFDISNHFFCMGEPFQEFVLQINSGCPYTHQNRYLKNLFF